MQQIWMYIIAHLGATCTFLRKSFLVQWGRATRTRQETLEFIWCQETLEFIWFNNDICSRQETLKFIAQNAPAFVAAG